MSRSAWISSRVRRLRRGAAAGLLLALSVLVLPAAALAESLTVGLYPYVPRLQQFQDAVTAAWAKVEPDVQLNFLAASQWDGGYDMNPPANADVFVFDAMFLNYFRAQGYLETIAESEITDPSDFLPYALDGVKSASGYSAIPLLGCTNILFYQKTDAAVATADTIDQLDAVLGQCSYTSQIPPDRRGLMIDMAGGTTNASLYLYIEAGIEDKWPVALPQSAADLDPTAVAIQRKMLAMASYYNGAEDPGTAYGRAAWYSHGWGRATVGFTESLSAMTEATRQATDFKLFPASNNTDAPNLFYSDVIGVNTTTASRGTRDLAVKLAGVMASSDVVVASIGPGGGSAYPQYLMPARTSVFQTLGRTFPKYRDMQTLVTNSNPVLFSLDADARTWLSSMKNVIKTEAREDYACGCDFDAVQSIPDNSAAAPICQQTCSAHGGWNGQWTNQYPASQSGSVCGCNACPAPVAVDTLVATPRAND